MALFARRTMRLLRTSLPDRSQAGALAHRLVDQGLAACAHVYELQSSYWWNGKREDEAEWGVEARTLPGMAAGVRQAMRHGHPYEVPLIESWEVAVDAAYAQWARKTMADRQNVTRTKDAT